MLRKNIIKNTCTFHFKLLACMVHKLSFSLHFLQYLILFMCLFLIFIIPR